MISTQLNSKTVETKDTKAQGCWIFNANTGAFSQCFIELMSVSL